MNLNTLDGTPLELSKIQDFLGCDRSPGSSKFNQCSADIAVMGRMSTESLCSRLCGKLQHAWKHLSDDGLLQKRYGICTLPYESALSI